MTVKNILLKSDEHFPMRQLIKSVKNERANKGCLLHPKSPINNVGELKQTKHLSLLSKYDYHDEW